MKALFILAVVIATSAAQTRDSGKAETCDSYTTITGTTTTDCRELGRKPTHCESYTNINGTTKTECR
jgi:hypothetical protein